MQKSPIYLQKSLIHLQKSPTLRWFAHWKLAIKICIHAKEPCCIRVKYHVTHCNALQRIRKMAALNPAAPCPRTTDGLHSFTHINTCVHTQIDDLYQAVHPCKCVYVYKYIDDLHEFTHVNHIFVYIHTCFTHVNTYVCTYIVIYIHSIIL